MQTWHFRHNIVEFEYLRHISLSLADLAHIQASLYHTSKHWGQKIFYIIILRFKVVLFAPQWTNIKIKHRPQQEDHQASVR